MNRMKCITCNQHGRDRLIQNILAISSPAVPSPLTNRFILASRRVIAEPFQIRPNREPYVASSAFEAVSRHIHPAMSVFVGTAAGTPGALTDGLAEYGATIRGKGEKISVFHIHTEGNAAYMGLPDVFHTVNFFTGGNARKAIANGDAEYAPMFLSEIPLLFRRGYVPLDVAMITVSPPDKHGYVSLGVSVDVVRSAVQVAKTTIAVINENVSLPRCGIATAYRRASLLRSAQFASLTSALPRRSADAAHARRRPDSSIAAGYGLVPERPHFHAACARANRAGCGHWTHYR